MYKLLLSLSILFATGCASVHQGEKATSIDGNDSVNNRGLVVSAIEKSELSSKNFGFINLTFENTTEKWITLDSINMKFKNKKLNKRAKIVVGAQLNAWAEGIRNQMKLEAYNMSVVLGSLAVTGAALSINKNKSTRNTGKGMFIMGLTGLAMTDIASARKKVTQANLVPEEHLLSTPLLIAPGYFMRRWILVYTEKTSDLPFEDTIYLSYKTEGSKKKTNMKIQFRKIIETANTGLNSDSEWLGKHQNIKLAFPEGS